MSTANPTYIRHRVIAVTGLMSILLYLDRFCISFAEIFIKEEFGLDDSQIGWILGCFFLTYALGQVPSGWLTDRFGARIMLTAYILFWSLFTGLTGAAYAFVVLLICRAGFGFAQAGAYPTSASVISKWVPFTNRGMASSIVAFGGRIGGAFAPLLTGYLIVMFVPTSVSSKLEKNDLLNVPRLSYEIMYGSDMSISREQASTDNPAARVGQHIRELSPELEQVIVPVARKYRSALDGERANAQKSGRKMGVLAVKGVPPFDEVAGDLVTQLNQLLERNDVYDETAFQGVRVEKEATRLLGKLTTEPLTREQTMRLNRLLLEGAYRDSIGKVYGHGWRRVMWVYGAAGFFVAGLYWFVFRNRPENHPRCNQAEVELIERSRPAFATRPHGRVGAAPMRWIIRSRSLWCSSVSQFFTNVGWVLLMTWAPRYFQSAHGVGVETRAWMVFIPPTIGWLGMLYGGRLTDRLVRVVGLRWGRALPISMSRFMAMAAYLACLVPWQSPWVVVALFGVVSFSTNLGAAPSWAFTQDVGGRHVGSVLGWGNMWGNIGAFLASRYLISLVGAEGNWNAVFVVCAGAFFISGAVALGINATIPIVPEGEEEA